MAELGALYDRLLRSPRVAQHEDPTGEAYNLTSAARVGQDVEGLEGLDPAVLTELDRYAQGTDTPATGLLAAPYEGLKLLEQKTGVPALTWASKLARVAGIPVSEPDETTSPATLGNVGASLQGAGAGLLKGLIGR